MDELADLYDYARAENIGVYNYSIGFSAAASIREGSLRAVFLDFDQLRTVPEINEAAGHEQGHHATGCYHKVDSPFETWERAEHRADRWFYEHYLSVDQFRAAFRVGCTEYWQLAEWFRLPEVRIKKALHYWVECRGVNFNYSYDDALYTNKSLG